ncbi:unnamed protein product [Calicophoron daubneyi]|uniref:Cilia-and flagella-associated protein 96 n=1 Tax=Calicophoron daubneyi TaxID=300641 RepID=A0AAV2TUT4_CALDB
MKPDLDRLGIFKEMAYHTINDRYRNAESSVQNTSAHKGRQMSSSGFKTRSALSDGYFSEFRRIFSGDCRVDMASVVRKQRSASKKLDIGKDWVPASGNKQPSGFGSCYGTFSGPIPHLKPTVRPIKVVRNQAKNILTTPGKKGCGSYADVTISHYPHHSTDPYDRVDQFRKKEADAHKQMTEKKGPFYSSTQPITYFDQNPYRTVRLRGRAHSATVRSTYKAKVPFKPSSPSKWDGGCKAGCFDPFPAYKPEHFRITKSAKSSSPIFRLSTGPMPYPVVSIVDKNVTRSINSANYAKVKSVVYTP